MYVSLSVFDGMWSVKEDDNTTLYTCKSKSAATRWMRDMRAAIRYDEQAESDEQFLAVYGPFPKD